jgi:molybdopterin converting factor small subunit
MPTVKFTYALKRFFPGLQEMEIESKSLPQTLDLIDKTHPGISAYIVDEQGMLRKHVNIFVNGSLIQDRKHLSDAIQDGDEIYIMQALSGG